MENKVSLKEHLVYCLVKGFGLFIRALPLSIALGIGKAIGTTAYYLDVKHKSIAYSNLKKAFADVKTNQEIKNITKKLFQNFGQNLIDLLRLPSMSLEKFKEIVQMDGLENITESLKQGKGVILLAMHFGSWEMASLACAMLGHPYKVIVKPQTRYTKLDELLNSYRSCGGSIVISRGAGTRDFIKALKNNEVIGMVMDQGGRDGVLVPFLGRKAMMSVGAIRMGLKFGVPICFSVIVRDGAKKHKMTFQKPFELINTGNVDEDIVTNLRVFTKIIEEYIRKYPEEYMWFYKIWKYSNETKITILSDGKVGHLRQSQSVARNLQKALRDRDIQSTVEIVSVEYKDKNSSRMISLISFLMRPFFCQGRLDFLKEYLTIESYKKVSAINSEYIISCGSSVAGLNNLLSYDLNAKSIAILRPGPLSLKRFRLVVLPQHDVKDGKVLPANVAVTYGAPNLIDEDYLKEKSLQLLNRFSHLKNSARFRVGVFVGGDSKHVALGESQVKLLVHQLKEVAQEINAEILMTTSRRTPANIEQLLFRELKKFERCPLLICANQENIDEAVGGIMGLADIIVVSGDSISMVSEAASSGKNTIVFSPQVQDSGASENNKHIQFIDKLNSQGFVLSVDVKNISRTIFDVAKNKIQSRRMDDNQIILEAVRRII